MPKPSHALRQWLQLRRSLSAAPAALKTHPSYFFDSSTALHSITNSIAFATRPFHSTQIRNAKARSKTSARPAPLARRKREQVANAVPSNYSLRTPDSYTWKDGMTLSAVGGDLQSALKQFNEEENHIYDAALKSGDISPEITHKTFKDVGKKLITAAHQSAPNSAAIRAISVDVDAVWRIGLLCSRSQNLFWWTASACAMAKAAMPTVIVGSNAVSRAMVPGRTAILNEVEKLAREGFPPAIVLHAKVLGMRGERKAAIELLEQKVLPYVQPTPRKPSTHMDITAGNHIPSPHRLYAFLQASEAEAIESKDSRSKSDEAIRIAAMEYNDREALLEYASLMMSEGNLEVYEECMSKAASAGEPKACLFLANFYYLTFHGAYPTRGQRILRARNQSTVPPSKPARDSKVERDDLTVIDLVNAAAGWFGSLFHRSTPQVDYRKLAHDWYYLAYGHGETKAAFMIALLDREDGNEFNARYFLAASRMEEDEDFADKMDALKANWYNRDFEPTLPKKMLAVR